MTISSCHIKKIFSLELFMLLSLSLLYAIILLLISINFYIPLVKGNKDSDDIYRLMELGNNYLNWGSSIPWWLLKGLPYFISGLTDDFLLFDLFKIYYIWALLLCVVVFLVLKSLNQAAIKLKSVLFITIFIFNPGVLYLGVTGRFEIASYIFLLFVVYCAIGKKTIFPMVLVAFLGRPTLLISTLFFQFIFFRQKCIKELKHSVLKIYFILCLILIICLFVLDSFIIYFITPWYLFVYYGDPLRDFINISSKSELWKGFIKPIPSFLFESFGYLEYDFSLESLLGLQGILRLILIALLFIKIIIYKNSLDRQFLNLYLIIVIPVILSVGFYQARYFIPFDMLLVIPFFFRKKFINLNYPHEFCIDTANFSSGDILKRVTRSHDDGRLHQELDCQTRSSVDDKNYSK